MVLLLRPLSEEERKANDSLKALLGRISQGDEEALAELFDATHQWVYRAVLKILGEPGAAEEATQEAYLRVWKSAGSYSSERGRVQSWLFCIARSCAIDRFRRQASHRRHEGSFSEAFEVAADTVHDPEVVNAHKERRERVVSALFSLPQKQRRVIELAYFTGLTHVEIAERLEEPLGSVKSRIRLGMLKLRELLRPLEESA